MDEKVLEKIKEIKKLIESLKADLSRNLTPDEFCPLGEKFKQLEVIVDILRKD